MVLLLLFVLNAFAAEYSCGDSCTATFDESSGTLTINGEGKMTDFEMYKSPWRSHNNQMKKVVITNGITRIGNYAFFYSTKIAEVSLPESMESIGKHSFFGCDALETITIPTSVISIEDGAFSSSGLTTITIPDSVETLGGYVFEGCDSLTEVAIGRSVSSIPNKAFYDSEVLESVTIGDSQNIIGSSSFASLPLLKEIVYLGENSPNVCGSDFITGSNNFENVFVPENFDEENLCGMNKVNSHFCYGETTQLATIITDQGVKCECFDLKTDYGDGNCECVELAEDVNGDNTCSCVELATPVNGENKCECGQHANEVVGQNKCQCDEGYHQVGNECKKIILCGEYTTQNGNTTNTQECQCVEHGKKKNETTCECESGYEGDKDKKTCQKPDGAETIMKMVIALITLILVIL